MEPQQEVRVYRDCVRGVRRVAGLKRQQLAAGVDVGVASGAGLSLLLSPRHIEFALVIDARCLPTSSSSASTSSSPSSSSSSSSSSNHASGGPQWLGFSYFGYLENLKRCFRKPHDDLLSYFKIIHENLTTQFSDPYASPLLFVGDSYEKAFWQISSPEAPHSVVGFIPFRPVSLFHSFKSHPIIAMEGGNYPIFTMISGIDRHRLRAVSPELEARYQQTVQTATALVSPHKLSHLQVHSVLSSKRAASPVANGNANANGHGNNSKKKTSADGRKYSGEVVRKLADDFYKHYASSKSEDKKSLQPILVSGLVLALGSVTREVELVTLSMASTGKTHLMQAAQILPPLTTGGGGGGKALKDNLSDADRLAKELDHYQRRLEQLKLLLAQEPRIAIYNPFLPAASTVLLPTPAPSSSAAAASSPAHHAHQPPQQQFDMSTQTASAAAAAAPSLLTASLQRPLTSAATSARHHQASTTIEFPSPTPVDNSNSNSAANGNGGRQPSPAPAFRAPSTYLPASSSSVSTPTSSAVSTSTSPSISLHSSASGPTGASVSNSGSGSLTPVSSMSHRLATASRPVTPSSFSSSSSSSSSINPARPFLRLSGSQDYTHAPDMSLLYRRLIELLYVAHPIPGGVGGSFAPSALSSPFAHQHPSPGGASYAGLRGSSTPPPSLGASSASLPVRRFFTPSAAPANTPLSLSRTSSGFIRRSASPSTITFLQPSTSSSSSASSSSWKRFPRATTPISSTIAFPAPAPAPAVDYADFVTPEQLLAANGNGGAGAQRQGDAELASHSPQALHHHRLHHRPQSQPAPVSPRASESPLQRQPPQPFSHPPQPYPHPHPLQQRLMGPPVPVPVQAAPAAVVAQPEPLPEHHPHAPAAGAPARVLRLSQSHPRMPEAHFGPHPHHQPQQQPALRASSGGLAPPATAEAVHPNESASDFLLRLIGANKDASQEDQARVAEAPTKGPVVLPLDPSHIDRSILASSVAAALAKHQQQHQHQQHQAQQQGHFGGVHVH